MAKKKSYTIRNYGCDDTTTAEFEFTEDEFSFLKQVFAELNTHSSYCCMPVIYIEERENNG